MGCQVICNGQKSTRRFTYHSRFTRNSHDPRGTSFRK
uniref:Uncharacterized protein n=1 Tax=Anguilla anguilla TaxID=7936 RepID=A0A0E9PKY3_ANGAN